MNGKFFESFAMLEIYNFFGMSWVMSVLSNVFMFTKPLGNLEQVLGIVGFRAGSVRVRCLS